jgi:hypothetical protein
MDYGFVDYDPGDDVVRCRFFRSEEESRHLLRTTANAESVLRQHLVISDHHSFTEIVLAIQSIADTTIENCE